MEERSGGAVITICLILFCVNVDAHELCLRAHLIKMENLRDFYLHMDDSIFCTLYQVSAGPVSIKTVYNLLIIHLHYLLYYLLCFPMYVSYKETISNVR